MGTHYDSGGNVIDAAHPQDITGLVSSKPAKGAGTIAAPATQPDGTARLILAVNVNRIKAVIFNDGAVGVYLGHTSAVSTSGANLGIFLNAGGYLEDDSTTSAWYGITTGATATIVTEEVV